MTRHQLAPAHPPRSESTLRRRVAHSPFGATFSALALCVTLTTCGNGIQEATRNTAPPKTEVGAPNTTTETTETTDPSPTTEPAPDPTTSTETDPTRTTETPTTGGATNTEGVLGVGDPYYPGLGNPGYDVSQYDLDLRVDDDLTGVSATTSIEAEATQDLDTVHLDFVGLEIDSISVDGKPAEYERNDPDLILTPTSAIKEGSSFTIEVAYHGKPSAVDDPILFGIGWIPFDGGLYVAAEPNAASTWFPCNDHPSDKALYDFHINVPREVEAIANGQKGEVTPDGERTTWEWSTTEPMATYLATIVVGQFTIIEQTGPNGLPITHAIADTEAEAGAQHLQDTARMIDYFDEFFGEYPLGSYGLIVLPNPLGFALETQNRSLFGSDLYQDAAIRAHELAHQWFGDSVSPANWDDVWLNEGFATYAEWMWDEASGNGTVGERVAGLGGGGSLDIPPADPGVDELFGQSVYVRGGAALHGIRTQVGDEKFFDIVRSWATEKRHGNGSTEEFIDLVESKTGTDWTKYFDDWLYQPSYPG